MTRHDGEAVSPPPVLLTVIIPVFNERDRVREILDRVLAAPVATDVILVDDGSTDGTGDILRTEVEGVYPNVTVLCQAVNRGKGAAIRIALPHARGDFIVIQDGDLEYDPADFPAMIAAMDSDDVSVVYGSRFLLAVPKMKPANRAINWLLPVLVRLLYGARLTDEATCYKMFRRELLQSMPLRCRRFEFCPEVTARVLKRGLRIVEVPIGYRPRTKAEGKKIRWTDALDAIWTLVKYRFRD